MWTLPTEKQINKMIQRTNRYACMTRDEFGINIEGFRLLHRTTDENLIQEWSPDGLH